MASIANIVVIATECIYRDKGKRILRVPKGRRCGFRIYTNTKMAEIMDKLTKVIWNVSLEALHFSFAGETVYPSDDFISLHMREADAIEVSHALSFFELPPSTLASDYRKLVGSLDGSDFLFKVGKKCESENMELFDEGSSSYKEIPGHQWILRVRNERFQGLFDSRMEESKMGFVDIPHHTPRAFELMLEYLYTDEIQGDILPKERLELLELADEYVIPRLKRHCELILMQNVKSTNAVELYLKSDLHQAEDLKSVCKEYLIEHLFKERSAPDFLKDLSKEALFELARAAVISRSVKKPRLSEVDVH